MTKPLVVRSIVAAAIVAIFAAAYVIVRINGTAAAQAPASFMH